MTNTLCQCNDPECGCMCYEYARQPATADRHGYSFCNYCFVNSETGRTKYVYIPSPSPYRELTDMEREYIEKVIALGKKYGLSLSHQDGHGAFLLVKFNELCADWLRSADYDKED